MANVYEWPAELPQSPLFDSLQFQKVSNKISSDVEVGEGKERRRYTGKRRVMSFAMNLTSEQKAIWDDFYDNILSDGVNLFSWKDPYTGETGVVFKFTDPAPKMIPISGSGWRVDAAVRRLF